MNVFSALLAALAAVFSGAGTAVDPAPSFVCPKYAICAPLFTPPPPLLPRPLPLCLQRCLPPSPVSRRLVDPAR